MTVISILVIPLLMLLLVAVPVLIGLYVYRDSKVRGMNSALWTLVAVLAPGFIGLIIYLVARIDYTGTKCAKCGGNIRPSFAVCPYCGISLKEHCKACGHVLEPGWVKCPECGEEIPQQQRRSPGQPDNDKGLKRILIIVIAVPVIVCILMLSAKSMFRVSSGNGYGTLFMEQMILSEVEDESVEQWIKECDEKGEGIYVLKSVEEYRDEIKTSMLLYRNDGMYKIEQDECDMGGFFKDAAAQFEYSSYDINGNPPRNYTLAYFEYTGKNECVPEISSEGMAVKFEIKNVDGFSVPEETSENYIYADVYVSDEAEEVYSVEWDLYKEDEFVLSECTSMANGMTMAGDSAYFDYKGESEDEVTAIVIKAYDEDGQELLVSEKIEVDDFTDWSFELQYGNDGDLVLESTHY